MHVLLATLMISVNFMQEIATRDKGRGVVADKLFQKGDFLCNYKGDLITKAEGERRMEQYGADLGSFLFFFNHNGNDLWFVSCKFAVPTIYCVHAQRSGISSWIKWC